MSTLLLRFAGLFALFLVGLDRAPAAEPAAQWEDVAHLRTLAKTVVADQTSAVSGAEVDALLDAALRLPRCEPSPQARITNGPSANGRWTVDLDCAGPVTWTLHVPVRLTQRQRLLVAARPLPAGHVVTADDLREDLREVSQSPQGYFSDRASLVGSSLRRSLDAGTVLTPALVQAQTLVRRGQSVTLVGRVAGLEVRANGRALSDAASNQRVRVENASTRRVIEGIVRGTDIVEVPS